MLHLMLAVALGAEPATNVLADTQRATLKTSSSNPNWKGYTFGAENLRDKDLGTSWQPKSKKSGVGETITVTFRTFTTVDKVIISNGFQREDELGDLFLLNSRIKTAELKTGAGGSVTCRFEETKRGPTECELRSGGTKSLSITITEVWPGSKWPDLAVSELEVIGTLTQKWLESDFVGEWVFSDGMGYTVKKNGRAEYNGPGGGPIDWTIQGDEVAFNRGLDRFRIISLDELEDTRVKQRLIRKK